VTQSLIEIRVCRRSRSLQSYLPLLHLTAESVLSTGELNIILPPSINTISRLQILTSSESQVALDSSTDPFLGTFEHFREGLVYGDIIVEGYSCDDYPQTRRKP